jgi:predicted enzyme related to lactoylglutathione lyase
MPVEIVNWIEIPVYEMKRARKFYEEVFSFKIVDMEVGTEIYPCFPNKTGDGFSGALVQYDFTCPGKTGPLVYLNAYDNLGGMLEKIRSAGGRIIEDRKEIAPGFGFFALFEDSEGNMLALQGER